MEKMSRLISVQKKDHELCMNYAIIHFNYDIRIMMLLTFCESDGRKKH